MDMEIFALNKETNSLSSSKPQKPAKANKSWVNNFSVTVFLICVMKIKYLDKEFYAPIKHNYLISL